MSKRNSLLKSFRFAACGILKAIKEERNMKIHLLAMTLVLIAAKVFSVSGTELAVLFLTIALVISLEMVNTAVEKAVDLVTEEYAPLAKTAKDVAAGAVLVAAIFSVCVAVAIFGDKILAYF